MNRSDANDQFAAMAAALNADTVALQQQEIRRLEAENERLRRSLSAAEFAAQLNRQTVEAMNRVLK